MTNCYLLTAGKKTSPKAGDLDWKGCYRCIEEAQKAGEKWLKQQRHPDEYWYKIIDLANWIETNNEEVL